jgi:hypothetical protein
MTTPRIPTATATAIQQRAASGHFFDGTFPTGDSPLDAGFSIYKYAPQNAGGLFYWNTVEPLVCSQIHVDCGAAANISILLVNLDPATVNTGSPAILTGETMTIEQATAAQFIALDESHFRTILLPFQGIQIITTNSSQAQIAQVVASLERQYVR